VRLASILLAVGLVAGACGDDTSRAGPQVTGILPTVGIPVGGYLVEITGSGFTGDETVRFGDLPATVVGSTPDRLLVVAPVAGLGSLERRIVDVVVSSGGADTVLADAFTFSIEVVGLLPAVDSIDPATVPNEGGVTATITGTGFGSDPRVFFGTAGVVEAEVVSSTPNRIEVVVPPAPAADRDALVDVAVHLRVTGHESRLFGRFQYGAAAAYVTGMDVSFTTPGAMVIEGFGFTEPVTVTFAGVGAQVLDVGPTSITVALPSPEITGCEPVSGPVVVETADARLTAPDPFTFGASVAFVTGYEAHEVEVDADGIVVADTPITVEGTGFVGETVIRIGGVEFVAVPDEAPPAESSATAVIPAGADMGGAPGGTVSGVLVNGQGCKVVLPGLLHLVRP